MAFGLTKEQIQQFYRPATPQITDEEKNSLRQMISDTYNSNAIAPTETQNAFVNPTLTDEQRQSAINFINTVYNGASQTNSNSTSTPSTSTLPVLKKSADAPIKKEEKKPNLKLVSDAQKSREQAIADAVRVNRVGESQNARQKAIDEARQREIDRNTVKKEEENVPTQIYDTDLMGNDISVGTLTKATPTPTSDIESGLNWVNEQAIKKKYKGASPVNFTTEDVAKGVEQGLKEGQAFTKQVYEDRAKETIGETLKKWSNPNYKLTKRDKETFRKKFDEADEKYGVANWWNYQGQQKIKKAIEEGKLTQEEANAYRDISIKLNPYLSYVSGVLNKTGGELVSAVNVAGEKAINKIAGTDYTAAQDTRNAFNRELQNAQTQNGLATGIGQFVGMGAEYALANNMLSGLGGEGLKWNLLRGQMADTALQTAPMVANNIFDEKYKKEDGSFDIPQLVADIGKDEATNLLMNGAFEVAPKIINPIIEGKVADRLEKQIEKAYKTSDDVVRANVEQDLKGTLSKYELQELLGRELSDDEYLKYVSGKQTSETVENVMEDVAKTSDDVAEETLKENNLVEQPETADNISNQDGVPTIETKPFSDTADEITPIDVNDLQNRVDNIGEVRPKNEHGMELTYVPESADVGRSKVVTNTLRRRNLASLKDAVDRRIATYKIEHEKGTLDNALKRVEDADGWTNKYLSDEVAVADATDIDTIMLLIEDKRYQAELARGSGFLEDAKRLDSEAYLLKDKLRKAGTRMGQNVNAFKKWNGTADGAILNAERILDNAGKKWAEKNGGIEAPRERSKNGQVEKLSKELDGILKRMTDSRTQMSIGKGKPAKTLEQISEEVRNTLKKYGIENNFTDDDVKFMAGLVEGGETRTLEDELWAKFKDGTFYTIDESIPIKKETNGKIASALRQIVEEGNEQAAKADISLEQLKEQIKNTLDNEYSSISKGFDDSDVDFLANMVNNGASSKDLADMLRTRIANGVWGYSDETIKKVNDLFDEARYYAEDSKARVDLETKAFWELANANNPKASITEKFDAWRYLAMLGNPKTHVRNMIGNTLFRGVTNVADAVATGMESGTDAIMRKTRGEGIERTKSILTKADDNLVKACFDDATENNYRALSGHKYAENIKNEIGKQREVFDTKALRKYSKVNSDALELEDFNSMRQKYKRSMAGYLKANGADETIFDAERQYKNLKKTSQTRLLSDAEKNAMDSLKKDVDLLEKARTYATNKAEYSAFHEDNKVAQWLSKHLSDARNSDSFAVRTLGKMGEGILPFIKTPANVLRSGLEFSPLNIVNDLFKGIDVAKGNIPISELFDSMAKTITGTGLVGLGYLWYGQGFLNSTTDDERWQDNLEGIQNYSLTIGDKTYTIDFAAPSVMPLLLGAEIRKLIDANHQPVFDEEGNVVEDSYEPHTFLENLEGVLNSVGNLASPIMETSMLSGLSDTLDSIAQANYGDALGNLAASTMTGYLTQSVPTVFGQVARTVDNTRRSTYSDKTGMSGQIDKQITKMENKLPFLSMTNEPYIDAYGREQRNGVVNTGNPLIDTLPNLLYQMVSPGYLQDINTTDVDTELRRLYKMTNGNSKFADLETSVKNSEGNKLSKEEYTDYSRTKGESIIPNLQTLFNSDAYKNASLNNQVKMKDDVLSLSKKIGKTAYDENYSLSGDSAEVKAYGDDQNIENFINYEKARYNDMGLSTEQALKLQSATPEEQATWKTVQDIVQGKGLTANEDLVEKYTSLPTKDFDKYVDYTVESNKYDVDVSKAGQKAYEEKGNLDGYVNEYLPKIKELDMQNNETNVDLWIKGGTKALENKVNETTQAKETKESLESYGLTSSGASASWQKAQSVIPSLTMQEFASTFKAMDTNKKGSISQDEIIAYLNKGSYSQSEGKQYWNAYGNKDWKSVLVLENGKWKKEKK